VVKGGSFKSIEVRLDRRVTNIPPGTQQDSIGFRTISRTPPAK
jgi:hypothetical protein